MGVPASPLGDVVVHAAAAHALAIEKQLCHGATLAEINCYRLSRQVRSKGSRHACGATNWWMAFGPQEPGAYGQKRELP